MNTFKSDMSLYDVLNQLYFVSAFSDDENNLSMITKLVKKTIKINFEMFSNKIMDEAKRIVERLKNVKKNKLMYRYGNDRLFFQNINGFFIFFE